MNYENESYATKKWCLTTTKMFESWYQKSFNTIWLDKKGYKISEVEMDTEGNIFRLIPFKEIHVVFNDHDSCITSADENTIFVSREWISKNPDDTGLVIFELIRVIIGTKSSPTWIANGIADYYRWILYENKNIGWLIENSKTDVFEKGYLVDSRASAVFILWIELYKSNGFIKSLTRSMLDKDYSELIFEKLTGQNLESLWSEFYLYAYYRKQSWYDYIAELLSAMHLTCGSR
ncbi:hypothetical protein GZ78_14515 [Endozoicomonas numazuensis]|uniref:Uncharacterized protein n=2 Tax=Endozoicomonas numazuensis TaxID=1137799 RepID=A0A081NF70_9GAMM|nr:hypothetical protein GZ78_14515 [Endozoicomonas numazuensis]